MPNIAKTQFMVSHITANNLGRVAIQMPHHIEIQNALESGTALTDVSEQWKVNGETLAASAVGDMQGRVLRLNNTSLGTAAVKSILEGE